jgi:hypothetical protein
MRRLPVLVGSLPLLFAAAGGCVSLLGYENDYGLGDASMGGSAGGSGDGSILDSQGGAGGGPETGPEAQAGSGGSGQGGTDAGQAGAAGGAGDASTDEPSEAGTLTVKGHVLDPYLQPVVAAKVRVSSAETVTDAAGAFQLDAASTPYDVKILAIRGGRSYGFAILGLNGKDPVIQLPVLPKLTPMSAKVTGPLAWPDAAASKALIWSDFDSVAAGDADWVNASKTQTTYTVQARWFGPSPANALLRALQWSVTGGLPSHFTGWTSADVAVTDGAQVDLAISPEASAVSDSTLQVNVGVPNTTSIVSAKAVYATVGNGVVSPLLINDTSTTESAQYVVAAVPGIHYVACGQAKPIGSFSLFNFGVACRRDLSAGTATVLSPPAPPVLVSPVNGQNGVSLNTNFTWTSAPNSVSVVMLTTLAGPTIAIMTAEQQTKIPDLSELGFPFPSKTGFTYAVWTTTGGSVSDAMGPDGLITRITDYNDGRGPRSDGDGAVSDASSIMTE